MVKKEVHSERCQDASGKDAYNRQEKGPTASLHANPERSAHTKQPDEGKNAADDKAQQNAMEAGGTTRRDRTENRGGDSDDRQDF